MRRTDREVTGLEEICSILSRCESGALALVDGDRPYAVPVSFGFEQDGASAAIYFHCAGEGKKLDLIRKNPNACFTADCSHRLIGHGEACSFSFEYESVVARGRLRFVEDADGKRHALSLIMRQYAPKREFEFPDAEISRVTVLRLEAGELTGKRANME